MRLFINIGADDRRPWLVNILSTIGLNVGKFNSCCGRSRNEVVEPNDSFSIVYLLLYW